MRPRLHPRRYFALALVVVAASTACSDAIVAPPSSLDRYAPDANALAGARIVAMTRNLYIGADVFPVFVALATPNPADDLPALLAALAETQETSWPARVAALADEIARARPHVLGLQEVSQIDVILPPSLGGLVMHVNFLTDLQAALAARGLNYVVASSASFSQVNIPLGGPFGISNFDNEVLLVDADRTTVVESSAFGQQFVNNLPPFHPALNLKRGFVVAQVTVDGVTFTVASTHLEASSGPALTLLRAAQATELVTTLGAASPAIILGDLNEGPGSPMHQIVTGAGFLDSWAEMRPGVIGFTCCHVSNLANATTVGVFGERIDYVMARGLTHTNGELLGSVTLHGTTPGDRVAGVTHPVWPSDHAGLSASILLPPPALLP